MLVASEFKRTFKIGRASSSDIPILCATISREQCRIIFKNNSWYILDGQENRESLNGTWRQFDSCSLNHNDEIRVSEYYLKVILINLV